MHSDVRMYDGIENHNGTDSLKIIVITKMNIGNITTATALNINKIVTIKLISDFIIFMFINIPLS